MTQPRISLEQWRSLLTVVDAGGYAQAAVAMHKSQSAVTYAVQKVEALLGVKVFRMVGRKAHLTPAGEVLYRRAKALLDEAAALEGAAGSLGAGWESELRVAAEIVFPTWLLLQSFARFAEERPQTRIELYESVLSGTEEALLQRKVDLAICSQIPQGFIGDLLMPIRFIAAAHPSHPLFQLGRELTTQDLREHCHLLIRDTGSRRRAGGELGAERSWTVSQKATSIHAAVMGMGFAWFPEDTVRGELERGELRALPLREGGDRWANLYLVFADRDYAGPGAVRLAAIIRQHVADQCRIHAASTAGQYSLKRSKPSMRQSSV